MHYTMGMNKRSINLMAEVNSDDINQFLSLRSFHNRCHLVRKKPLCMIYSSQIIRHNAIE